MQVVRDELCVQQQVQSLCAHRCTHDVCVEKQRVGVAGKEFVKRGEPMGSDM